MEYRVYRLMAEGVGMVKAADRLGITRQSVQGHRDKLVRIGALRQVEGSKSPKLYTRGARAGVYERMQEAQETLRGGRGPHARRALAGCRVHRGAFKIKVAPEEPKVLPAWESTWENNGTAYRQGRFTVGGTEYTVRHCLGRRRASLVIKPAPMMVDGPAEVAAIEDLWKRQARNVAEHFRAAYGFRLLGGVELNQPLEYGFDTPGAPKFGRAGVSPVWGDGSTHTASTEAESRDKAWAVAMAALPDHQAAQDAHLLSLDSRMAALQAQAEAAERHLAGAADVLERHGRALSQAARAQVAATELAMRPPDDLEVPYS